MKISNYQQNSRKFKTSKSWKNSRFLWNYEKKTVKFKKIQNLKKCENQEKFEENVKISTNFMKIQIFEKCWKSAIFAETHFKKTEISKKIQTLKNVKMKQSLMKILKYQQNSRISKLQKVMKISRFFLMKYEKTANFKKIQFF